MSTLSVIIPSATHICSLSEDQRESRLRARRDEMRGDGKCEEKKKRAA